MRVNSIFLYKLNGYTSDYNIVPDKLNNDDNYHELYNNLFSQNFYFYDVRQYFNKGCGVPKNMQTTITINLPINTNPCDFNYIVLSPSQLNTLNFEQNFDVDDYGFYFITNYNINNDGINNLNSVTFDLLKDVWLSNYPKIVDTVSTCRIARKHMSYVNENSEFYTEDVCDDVEFIPHFVCTSRAKYDALFVKIVLDPTHSYFITDSQNNRRTLECDLNSTVFPTVYMPLNVYYKGTKDNVSSTVIETSDGADVAIQYTVNMGALSISSPYIIDASLTFNPPFEVLQGFQPNQLVTSNTIGGTVSYQSSETLVRPVVANVIYCTNESTTLDEYDGEDNLGYVDGYNSTTTVDAFWYPSVDEYRRRISLYGEKLTSFYDLKDITIDAYTYPYNYPVLKIGNNEIPLMFSMKPRRLRLYHRNVLGGTRHNVYLDVGGEEITTALGSIITNQTSQMPNSISAYQNFVTNNINQFNYLYASKLVDQGQSVVRNNLSNFASTGQIASGIAGAIGSGYMGNYGGMVSSIGHAAQSAMSYGANYFLNIEEPIIDTVQILGEATARIMDLRNSVGVIVNSNTSAIGDIINQDRCRFILKTAVWRPFYTFRLVDCHKYGTIRRTTGKVLNNVRVRFDYVKSIDCVFPSIYNNVERRIIENIFNNGVIKWHIDNTHTLTDENAIDYMYKNEDKNL